MKCAFSSLILISVILTGLSGIGYGQISRDQREALEALGRYVRIFNEEEWSNEWNKNWSTIPKEYSGNSITIKDGNVTEINLNSKNLGSNVQFPTDIRKLTYLEKLTLSYNRLSKIPAVLGQLKQLKYLALNNNRLKGKIPEQLGCLTNLTELYLSNNRLSGGIPAKLRNLNKLRVIDLNKNQLKGNIPLDLLDLENLVDKKSDIRWNALYVEGKTRRHQALEKFLTRIQKDKEWKSTQTVAPPLHTIHAQPIDRYSIRITWHDIRHAVHTDYYITYINKNRPQRDPHIVKWKGNISRRRCFIDIHKLEPSTTYRYSIQSETPGGQHNQNIVKSEKSHWKEVTTRGSTIFGKARISIKGKLEGVPDVKVFATNRKGIVKTNEEGEYNLDINERDWKGAMHIERKGYTFSVEGNPGQHTVEFPDGISGDIEINFEAELTSVVSGWVTDMNDKPVEGVKLSFFDAKNKGIGTATTDEKGYYRYIVPPGWSGRIEASKGWYKIDPKHSPLGTVYRHRENTNFVANVLAVTGTIKGRGNKTLPGIEVTFKNALDSKTTTTDSDGKYSHIVSFDWTGVIIPRHEDYIFHRNRIKLERMRAQTKGKKDHFDFYGEKNWKLFLELTANYMLPSEPRFPDIYGSGALEMEVAAGYKILPPFYLWAGYGLFSRKGSSPFFKEPSTWEEQTVSLGLGYNRNLSILMDVYLEAGMFYVMYSEKAFSERKSGSTFGVLRLNGGGIYKFTPRLFGKLTVSYLWASDTAGSFKIKLGGLKTGIGVGLRF